MVMAEINFHDTSAPLIWGRKFTVTQIHIYYRESKDFHGFIQLIAIFEFCMLTIV
jgi:hypothetical protein